MKTTSPLAALLALAFGAGAAGAQTLPADIAESKTVTIAVNAPYVPLEMRDPKTNELIGFDIDLSKAMGKVLGVAVEHQDGAFEAMTPALQSGRVNMIMSGFYDRPARREMFDFVDYLRAGSQFFTREENTEIKSFSDLCGQSVGTIRGTAYPDFIKKVSDETCVAAGKQPITVTADNEVPQMLLNMRTGRIVAAMQGLESVPAIMSAEPGTYRTLGEPLEQVYMGIAFNKTDSVLRDAFVSALKTTMADGTYAELATKWGLGLSTIDAVHVNGEPVK